MSCHVMSCHVLPLNPWAAAGAAGCVWRVSSMLLWSECNALQQLRVGEPGLGVIGGRSSTMAPGGPGPPAAMASSIVSPIAAMAEAAYEETWQRAQPVAATAPPAALNVEILTGGVLLEPRAGSARSRPTSLAASPQSTGARPRQPAGQRAGHAGEHTQHERCHATERRSAAERPQALTVHPGGVELASAPSQWQQQRRQQPSTRCRNAAASNVAPRWI